MAAANVFHLSSHQIGPVLQIHIAYSTAADGGPERLEYQDAAQTLQFTRSEIHVADSDAGTIISVTIRKTVDSGYTSFSVLIPRTNIDPNSTIPINTFGLQTLHRSSVVPALNKGQLDTCSVIALSGMGGLLLA